VSGRRLWEKNRENNTKGSIEVTKATNTEGKYLRGGKLLRGKKKDSNNRTQRFRFDTRKVEVTTSEREAESKNSPSRAVTLRKEGNITGRGAVCRRVRSKWINANYLKPRGQDWESPGGDKTDVVRKEIVTAGKVTREER